MKKIAFFSVLVCVCVALVSCSSANGSGKSLSNAEIIAFYETMFKSQMPEAQLSINKREQLSGGFESVELVIKVREMQMSEILFVKDDYIFPDVIDVRKQKSFRQDFEMKQYQSARTNFESKAKVALKDEHQIIALGDAKKPKLYVFSDPECPFCRQHLAGIEKELENYQINFVLTTVHGNSDFKKDSAFKKVAQIYAEAKNAKTDAAKIAILRKYYDEKAKTPKVAQKAYDEAVALYEKYAAMGLRSVPTFVEAE